MRQFSPLDTDVWRERYGTYADGDITINANTIYDGVNAGLVGTYTVDPAVQNPTITLDSTPAFQNGDLIVIHQTRGAVLSTAPFATFRWEFNKVKSGGGTNALTLEYPLTLPYQDDGAGAANQAQVLEVKSYKDVVTNAGDTWGPAAWDGNIGGLFFFFAKTITNNGILDLNSKGFRGGTSAFTARGTQGEGIAGIGNYLNAANTNGGGAGQDFENQTGAGGGNLTSGSNGRSTTGGSADGNDTLTLGSFGGGGGSAGIGGGHAGVGPTGGTGGGFGGFFSPSITGTGTIRANGGNGAASFETASAPGAGGDVIIAGESLDLTGMTITVDAGAIASGTSYSSGQASQGRVRMYYAAQLTGTFPSFSTVQSEYFSNLYAHEGVFSTVNGALQQEKYKRNLKVESF